MIGGGGEEDSIQQSIGDNSFMLWWAERGKDKPIYIAFIVHEVAANSEVDVFGSFLVGFKRGNN